MAEFAEYTKKEFQTRQEAEKWAKERKEELKGAEQGVPKIDIDFNAGGGGTWTARILYQLP